MSNELALMGLDGENPLGFLAALGALRALVGEGSSGGHFRMHWQRAGGSWHPVISSRESSVDSSEVVEVLQGRLSSMRDHAAFALGDDLSVSPDTYRTYAGVAAESATLGSQVHAEFAAAFASESVINEVLGKDPVVEDTALRTMSGAGHQHFLGFMRQLVAITTANDLRDALFEDWRYRDGKPSLRWDPDDDRR